MAQKKQDDNSAIWQLIRDRAGNARNAGKAVPVQSTTKTNTADTQGRSGQTARGSSSQTTGKPQTQSSGSKPATSTGTTNKGPVLPTAKETLTTESPLTQLAAKAVTSTPTGINMAPPTSGKGFSSPLSQLSAIATAQPHTYTDSKGQTHTMTAGGMATMNPLENLQASAFLKNGQNQSAAELRSTASKLDDNSAAKQGMLDTAGFIRNLSPYDQKLPDEQRTAIVQQKNVWNQAQDYIGQLNQWKSQLAAYGADTDWIDAEIASAKAWQSRAHDIADANRAYSGYTGGNTGNEFHKWNLSQQYTDVGSDNAYWAPTERAAAGNDTFDIDEYRGQGVDREKWIDPTWQLKENMANEEAYANYLRSMGDGAAADRIMQDVQETADAQRLPKTWDERVQNLMTSAGNRVAGSLLSFGSLTSQATENAMANNARGGHAAQLKMSLDDANKRLRHAQNSGNEAEIEKWQGEVDRLKTLLYGEQKYDENGNLREEWIDSRVIPAWNSTPGVSEQGHALLEKSRQQMNAAKRGLGGMGQFAMETAGVGLENIPTMAMYAANPALGAAYMAATVEGEMGDRFSFDENGEPVRAQEALLKAAPYVAVETATEALGDSAILGFIRNRGSLGLGGIAARAALTEGAEEGAAGILDYGLDYAYGNPEVRTQTAGQIAGDIFKQAVQGGIVGAVMGAGGAFAADSIGSPEQQIDPDWWQNVDTSYSQPMSQRWSPENLIMDEAARTDYLDYLTGESARAYAQGVGSNPTQAAPVRYDPRTWGDSINELVRFYREGGLTEDEYSELATNSDWVSAIEETANRQRPNFSGTTEEIVKARADWAIEQLDDLAKIQTEYNRGTVAIADVERRAAELEEQTDESVDVRGMVQKKTAPAKLKQTEQEETGESVDVLGMAKASNDNVIEFKPADNKDEGIDENAEDETDVYDGSSYVFELWYNEGNSVDVKELVKNAIERHHRPNVYAGEEDAVSDYTMYDIIDQLPPMSKEFELDYKTTLNYVVATADITPDNEIYDIAKSLYYDMVEALGFRSADVEIKPAEDDGDIQTGVDATDVRKELEKVFPDADEVSVQRIFNAVRNQFAFDNPSTNMDAVIEYAREIGVEDSTATENGENAVSDTTETTEPEIELTLAEPAAREAEAPKPETNPGISEAEVEQSMDNIRAAAQALGIEEEPAEPAAKSGPFTADVYRRASDFTRRHFKSMSGGVREAISDAYGEVLAIYDAMLKRGITQKATIEKCLKDVAKTIEKIQKDNQHDGRIVDLHEFMRRNPLNLTERDMHEYGDLQEIMAEYRDSKRIKMREADYTRDASGNKVYHTGADIDKKGHHTPNIDTYFEQLTRDFVDVPSVAYWADQVEQKKATMLEAIIEINNDIWASKDNFVSADTLMSSLVEDYISSTEFIDKFGDKYGYRDGEELPFDKAPTDTAENQTRRRRKPEHKAEKAPGKPGLVVDDYVLANVSRAEQNRLDAAAKALGLEVRFVDRIVVDEETGVEANAQIEGRTVRIEKNNPNPLMTLFGHELIHHLQAVAPDAYRRMKKYFKAQDGFKEKLNQMKADYRTAGITASDAFLEDEVVADMAGELIDNEDLLRRFIQANKKKNQNVLQQFFNWLRGLIAKLGDNGRIKEVDRACKLIEDALDEAVMAEFKKSGGVRNSVKFDTEVFEGDDPLMAARGTSYEALLQAIKDRCFVSPSIAVEPASAHGVLSNEYGENYVFFPRSVVDPERNRKNILYQTDAWTPTTPDPEVLREAGIEYTPENALSYMRERGLELGKRRLRPNEFAIRHGIAVFKSIEEARRVAYKSDAFDMKFDAEGTEYDVSGWQDKAEKLYDDMYDLLWTPKKSVGNGTYQRFPRVSEIGRFDEHINLISFMNLDEYGTKTMFEVFGYPADELTPIMMEYMEIRKQALKYFEAKPDMLVPLYKASVVVLSEGMAREKDMVDEIDAGFSAIGTKVIRYKRGDRMALADAVEQALNVPGVRFSIKKGSGRKVEKRSNSEGLDEVRDMYGKSHGGGVHSSDGTGTSQLYGEISGRGRRGKQDPDRSGSAADDTGHKGGSKRGGRNSLKTDSQTDAEYMRAVESGDMETAQRMVDEKANTVLNATLLPDDSDEAGFKYHRGPAPTKTFKRYAVFNVSEDGFRAAYAGNANPTPVGVWIDAQNLQSYMSDVTQFADGTFASYIPGDTGFAFDKKFSPELKERMVAEYGLKRGQRFLLERGGKHSSDWPNFSQMNLKQDENGNRVRSPVDGALPHNKLIFEIEYGISEDGDLTDYVRENGRMDAMGRNQGLAKIGPNQFYDFKTNPNAVGNWGIGGTFRIVRLVPHSEVISKTEELRARDIQAAKDAYDRGEIKKSDMTKRIKSAESVITQKWVGGYHPEDFGLSVESVDEMAAEGRKMKLPDAVTYDDDGNVIPLSKRFDASVDDARYSLKITYDKRWGITDREVDRNEGNDQPAKTITEIVDWVQTQLGVDVSSGRMSRKPKSANGYYTPDNQGIRMRMENNLPTLTHELGHWLDDVTSRKSGGKIGDFVSSLSDEARDELVNNTDVANRYEGRRLQEMEGFAEFIREFLKSKSSAAAKLPTVYRELYNGVDARDMQRLDYLADMVNSYMMGPKKLSSAVRRQNDRVDTRTKFQQAQDRIDSLYQTWVDTNHAIELMTRETGDRAPYIAATNAAYAAHRAGAILTKNMYSLDGTTLIGPSLKHALEGAGLNMRDDTEYMDFGAFLVAKHGVERLDRGRVMADDRMNDKVFMRAELVRLNKKYPHFKDAAKALYSFQKDFLYGYAVESGILSRKTADEWQDMWEFYVPFQRYMRDKRGTAKSAQKGFANQVSGIYKFKGSSRDIIHPVDSVIGFVTRMTTVAVLNDTMRTITRSAKQHDLNAQWMRRIETPMTVTKAETDGFKRDVWKYLEGNLDMDAMTDKEIGLLKSGLFALDKYIEKYSAAKPSGNVVTVYEKGKAVYWEVKDTLLLDSLASLNPKTIDGVAAMAATMTRFMTSNITGRNVVWSLMSNAPRDLFTALVFTKGKGIKGRAELIKGLKDNAVAYFTNNESHNPYYDEFLAMGGGQITSWNADINNAQKIQKQMNRQITGLFSALDYISAAIESGPRFAEFQLLRKQGYTPQEAFYGAMDITTNFARHGDMSRGVNYFVPFFNASVQGIDKFSRWIRATDVEGTKADRQAASTGRILAWAAGSALMAAIVYGFNNRDDDSGQEYKMLSNYTKNTYFSLNYGDGRFLTIPKPREVAVLESFFESLMDYAIGGDKEAFGEFGDYAIDQFAPPVVAPLAQGKWLNGVLSDFGLVGAISAVNSNKDFLGNPIEGQSFTSSNTPVKERYNSNTSRLAKWLAGIIADGPFPEELKENASPVKLDYFCKQVFGGFWKAQQLMFPVDSEGDSMASRAGKGFLEVVFGGYTKDALYSNDVVNALYDYQTEQKQAGNEGMGDFDAEFNGKLAERYTGFYSKFYKLTKADSDSDEVRDTRRSVLDTIQQFLKQAENDAFPDYIEELRGVAANQGDKTTGDLLPQVFDTKIKDAAGVEHALNGQQYYELQTRYNSYYADGAQAILANDELSAAEKAAGIATMKSDVASRAKREVLEMMELPTSAVETAASGAEKTVYTDKFEDYADKISTAEMAGLRMTVNAQTPYYDPHTHKGIPNSQSIKQAKAIADFGLNLSNEETADLMRTFSIPESVVQAYLQGSLDQAYDGIERAYQNATGGSQ